LKKSKEQVQADTTTTGGWEDKKQLLKPCTLILVNGSGVAPETIELKRGVNTIGRKSSSSQSSIQIQGDEYISRNHATIEVVMKKDGNFEHRLSDNNSKNRTYHNDTPLEAGDISVLMPGDTVGFGLRTVFKMCYGINDL
jgi:pSer/pThr/pTyr-binding forkhead associated (FHA) protein